ncbi:MAG: VOC family protein [Acidimicrobiia bacterium]|nr:VOC family protein [Acidimicrobiia bacterium]
MLRIDHFCIGSRHLYEGAERFRAETGLDSYDGGWFPGMGVGQRIVPLGDLCYIEIESVIDRGYGHLPLLW